MDAKLPCPLCRQVIERTRVYLLGADVDPTQPVAEEEVRAFKAERRAEYRNQFPAVFRAGAGFIGRGKLARSVGAAALSELALREAETRGGERMMNAGKATITRFEDTLLIDYKVGRSKRHESVPYEELEPALEDLRDQLAGDCISDLDVAVYHPEHFWLFRHHGIAIDDALQRIGAAAKRVGRK